MSPIFQTSGALSAQNPTYIERHADQEALHAALDGEYLHLVAPRQTGKTSLLKRLAFKLTDLGWRCAYVDLSTLMDLPKLDWYDRLGRALAYYLTPDEVPALTNQIDLRSYLLDRALSWQHDQPCIAILFDEVEGAGKARDIDGKAFSDTFFMTLRNLYIQRDDYNGILIVALAGAVDPADLVKDSDISPFNVGVEVVLDDFTRSEALLLTKYLEKLDIKIDENVHQAIYAWTNGHPYLIQRICATLEKTVRNSGLTAITLTEVDHVVDHGILKQANLLRWDNNLRHVAKMINYLSPPAAHLWSQLQAGKSLTDEGVIPSIYLELYLTGAIKTRADHLIIRNRIYEKAFLKEIRTEPTFTLNQGSKLMSKQPRIFLSSTWQDLQPEREAVEKALHRIQDTNFAGMEYFGSRPETPEEVSLAEVDRSNIYVGIFAHRFGSGITEAEYRRARDHNLPCLIYIKDDSAPIPPSFVERDPVKIGKLEALQQELKAHHIVSSFTSPDQLATQVVADLHNLLRDASIQGEAEPSKGGSKNQINITHGQGIVIGDGAQVTQYYSTTDKVETIQPTKSQPHSPHVDVLLVTVTEVEAKAILTLFQGFKRHFIGDKTYYDLGIINGASTYMMQSEMGPLGPGGAFPTVWEGIKVLSPSAVAMVGIAFGVDPEKQHIGEILVSRQILDYELQRVGSSSEGKLEIIPRGSRPEASTKLLDRFRDGYLSWQGPKVHFGLILSGAKLVDNQDFRDQLRVLEPEAIGGEMEGAGLYAAAQRNKVDWILVKGICDWADGKKHTNKSQPQKKAADNAARFAIHVIQQGGFSDQMQEVAQEKTTSTVAPHSDIGDKLASIKAILPTSENNSETSVEPPDDILMLVDKYYKDIMSSHNSVSQASLLFGEGNVIRNDQYKRVINLLHKISEPVRGLLATIERLPMDIKPKRYPLMKALHEVENLVKELEWFMAESRRASSQQEIQHRWALLLQSFANIKDSFSELGIQFIDTQMNDFQVHGRPLTPTKDIITPPVDLPDYTNTHKERSTLEPLDVNQVNPIKLSEAMLRAYNLSEFKSLCWRLQVIYDNLEGETLKGRMESLIGYFQRRNYYGELVRQVLEDRSYLTEELREK